MDLASATFIPTAKIKIERYGATHGPFGTYARAPWSCPLAGLFVVRDLHIHDRSVLFPAATVSYRNISARNPHNCVGGDTREH